MSDRRLFSLWSLSVKPQSMRFLCTAFEKYDDDVDIKSKADKVHDRLRKARPFFKIGPSKPAYEVGIEISKVHMKIG